MMTPYPWHTPNSTGKCAQPVHTLVEGIHGQGNWLPESPMVTDRPHMQYQHAYTVDIQHMQRVMACYCTKRLLSPPASFLLWCFTLVSVGVSWRWPRAVVGGHTWSTADPCTTDASLTGTVGCSYITAHSYTEQDTCWTLIREWQQQSWDAFVTLRIA